ncbi:MAG: D-alanyl-D-alanine carboxypeptidase/D-alanyl-D-alanine-endopeptidase [bacterium]|nr:D-alanyl-D-alanine carboxypeptidase/D-alanyl-D-alanine-endopeptidase [bacterium]
MRRIGYFLNLIFCLAITAIVFAVDKPDVRLKELRKDLDEILASRTIRSAQVGVCIVSLRPDNGVIYAHNAEKAFIPASCMKIFTSAAALDTLGSQYTYKTVIYQKGKIDSNGVLQGDLIIRGTGDPSISGRYRNKNVLAIPQEFADQLLAAGIRKVQGNLIADATYFDNRELGWGWSYDYLDAWYAAKVAALSFNDNCIDVYIRPGKNVGDPAVIRFNPPTNYATAINKITTAHRGTRASIRWDWIPNSQQIEFRGSVPLHSGETLHYIAVDNPTMYTLTVLKETFEQKGIQITGHLLEIRQPLPSPINMDCKPVANYTSPPLGELLKKVNKNSHNFFAEQLLKTVGAVKYQDGSYDAGVKVVQELMQRAKIDSEGFEQVDGSGLSAYNKVTPEQLVGMLKYMYRHPEHQSYYDSFSIPGVDGTLRSRFKGLGSRMRAKTGSIKMVSSLAGYLTTKSGEPVAFAILFNNMANRGAAVAVEDKIVNRLAEF